jgi:putative transposase
MKYKTEWMGIKVMEISEAYSSQTCHNCHIRDKAARKAPGLFVSRNCGLDTNADYNGSTNIMQRALRPAVKGRGTLTIQNLW